MLQLFSYPRPLSTWRWKVWETGANNNNIVRLNHWRLRSYRYPRPHWSSVSNPQLLFLINMLLLHLWLGLLSDPSWYWCSILGISILSTLALSLAIWQRCYAHLLLFECYLIFISIGIGQAVSDPKHWIPLVIYILLILFMLLLGSLVRDRWSYSVEKVCALETGHCIVCHCSTDSFFQLFIILLTLLHLTCLNRKCRRFGWACRWRIEAIGYGKAWLLRNQFFVIEGRNTEFGL